MTALRCKAIKKNGEQCGLRPIKGGTVCQVHGGRAPQVKKKAAIRAEVMSWGLGDAHVDPGETLLRLVSQSAARAEHYGRLLQEAYDAAERLKHDLSEDERKELTEDVHGVTDGHPHQALEDLRRIFRDGGVTALVGNTYGAAKDIGVYISGEAIRGLAKLEAEERERCANFAAKAVAAGLAERAVRLAEAQGQLMAEVIRSILGDLDLSIEQQELVPAIVRRHLTAVPA